MTDWTSSLPDDAERATLVGRAWTTAGVEAGPSVIVVEDDQAWDVTSRFPTLADLLDTKDPVAAVRQAPRTPVGPIVSLLENSAESLRDSARPFLLAPADLQSLKACGVTFVASLLERLVEERARGSAASAIALREELEHELGALDRIQPGSSAAASLKTLLSGRGLWSQYLEVGFGPDAEVFTKAQPMSAVGTGARIGVLAGSSWNNPEPELVLAVSSAGRIVGATLGNDVNLRDYEGRSALLLGQAKDNNRSCAIGPFIRLLDERFGLDDLRALDLELRVTGDDGFDLTSRGTMSAISRDVTELVSQAMGRHRQHPDGLLLFTGTMFVPNRDRDRVGAGFTHHPGDVVRISSPPLGALVNVVDTCESIAPWTFGVSALMRNLARRGLLGPRPPA